MFFSRVLDEVQRLGPPADQQHVGFLITRCNFTFDTMPG